MYHRVQSCCLCAMVHGLELLPVPRVSIEWINPFLGLVRLDGWLEFRGGIL